MICFVFISCSEKVAKQSKTPEQVQSVKITTTNEDINTLTISLWSEGVNDISELERVLREGFGFSQKEIDAFWNWKREQRRLAAKLKADEIISKIKD
jgi:hypothetical protein